MTKSGAKIVAEALAANQVKWIFGIPGTHNIELYDAMIDEPTLSPTLITDEQSAGFMADGVWRASGQLAAINIVPGAGLTHAMSGIAECYLDQIPLLVLACGIRNDSPYGYQLHDVDQMAIVAPVCKKVFKPQNHQALLDAINEACLIAKQAPYGPVAVEVPANLYLLKGAVVATIKAHELGLATETTAATATNATLSAETDAAVEQLNKLENVALYVGLGALGASSLLPELAKKLDAIVFTTISGKGVYSELDPRWAWCGLGRTLPPPLAEVESQVDGILAIGCRFGEVATGSYGLVGDKKLIHVDCDSKVIGRNFKTNAAVVGDANQVIRLILSHPLLKKREAKAEKLAKLKTAHERVQGESRSWIEQNQTESVSPELLFKEIQKIYGDDTIFVTDSGNGLFLGMEHLRLKNPRSFLAPVDYSSMGYSVPAGIGAALACPNRPVVVLAGDGAFMMTGLELLTATQNDCGLTVFLLRDRELSQIAQFQEASLGRKTKTTVANYNGTELAQALGLTAMRVSNNTETSAVVSAAQNLAKNGKTVFVEVQINYSRPTYFSKGAIKTNFLRLQWSDRLRLAGRLIGRKLI